MGGVYVTALEDELEPDGTNGGVVAPVSLPNQAGRLTVVLASPGTW
jgi:hypothetical protein